MLMCPQNFFGPGVLTFGPSYNNNKNENEIKRTKDAGWKDERKTLKRKKTKEGGARMQVQ